MNILGLSFFFRNAGACLIKDGTLYGAAEERFSRSRNDMNFPKYSTGFCLDEAGIDADDIDCIVFYEKPLVKFERLLFSMIETFPSSYRFFMETMPSWLRQKMHVTRLIRKQLNYAGEILFIPHHVSHGASAFFASPFSQAAILILDDAGEWVTTATGSGMDNRLRIHREIHFPHSLGFLYSAITSHLGFRPGGGEKKVMELAAYGQTTFTDAFRKLLEIHPDGSFTLNMKYFSFHRSKQIADRNLSELLGKQRLPTEDLNQTHMNIAASLQDAVEKATFNLLRKLHEDTGQENLCLAGQLSFNKVLNRKITTRTPFKRLYIPPEGGECGAAFGAAAFACSEIFNDGRPRMPFANIGPHYGTEGVKEFLKTNGIIFEELDDHNLQKKIAQLVFENNIIALFRGKMEWCEDSLGARSIFANPCNPEMKTKLNRLKTRESFRPLAAIVTRDDAAGVFDLEHSPFMEFSAQVNKEAQEKLPAIVHVDGSTALQTLTEEDNSFLHGVLKNFEKLSGFPVFVNTSFNIMGEPVVGSPEDALNSFLNSDIDYLFIENICVNKRNY